MSLLGTILRLLKWAKMISLSNFSDYYTPIYRSICCFSRLCLYIGANIVKIDKTRGCIYTGYAYKPLRLAPTGLDYVYFAEYFWKRTYTG